MESKVDMPAFHMESSGIHVEPMWNSWCPWNKNWLGSQRTFIPWIPYRIPDGVHGFHTAQPGEGNDLLVFSSWYLPSSNVTQGENSSNMIHYAQYCLHSLSLVSLHGVTLSHPLKDQCSHLQMPCSMKDSSDPLVMFVYCTCYHWLCNILVGCS